MRRFGVVLVGLLVIGLALSIFLPIEPQVPDLSSITVPAGQAERALHLELGLIYERGRQFDQAQREYEQAISPQDDSISEAAKAGIVRVLSTQNNPWFNIQGESRAFLVWLVENGLKLVLFLVIFYLLLKLIARLLYQPGYLITPFDDSEDGRHGKLLARVINNTVHHAKSIHFQQQSRVFLFSEKLEVPSFGTLADEQNAFIESLKAIDSFTVGTVNLPLGRLVLAIQRWGRVREYVIGGSVEKYGNKLCLTAHVRNGQTGKVEKVWTISETIQEGGEDIMRMGETLAYQILHDISPHIEARSGYSLMQFSKAIETMQQYRAGEGNFHTLETMVDNLEDCLASDPTYLLAKYNLGLAYSAVGRYDEARQIFREIKSENHRLYAEASYNLGSAFYHKFQDWAYNAAQREFEDVLEKLAAKTSDGDVQTLQALAYCGLAMVHAQKIALDKQNSEAHFKQAEDHSKRALQLAGDTPDVCAAVHSAMGIAHLRCGALEESIAQFRLAIHLKADYYINYIYLADIFHNRGEDETSVQYLQRAIRYNPKYEYAHYKLGMIYKALEQFDLAIAAWRQAPSTADAHNEIGKLLASQKRYDEALDEFRQAMALNKHHSECLSNLAWYIIEAGKTDEESLLQATEYARKCLQLERGTSYEWHRQDILGWVYYNRKLYVEARRELEASVLKNPHKLQNRYHLALVYQANGNNQKARSTLLEGFKNTEEKGIWRDKVNALLKELRE